MRAKALLVGMILIGAACVPGTAEVITYRNGFDNALVTGYDGCDDSMLVNIPGQNNDNYGANARLYAGNTTYYGDAPARIIIRFDLTFCNRQQVDIFLGEGSFFTGDKHASQPGLIFVADDGIAQCMRPLSRL